MSGPGARDAETADAPLEREPMPYGRVLVVDDTETNLLAAKGLLLPYQLKIVTVSGGSAAVKRIEAGQTFDVIFMDLVMPETDGAETTRRLRTGGYTGPVVAMTSGLRTKGGETDADTFAADGFDGYITKPIDPRALQAALNRFVRDRHPEEAALYKRDEALARTAGWIPGGPDNQLLRIFRRDAEKAAATLRETLENRDIGLFIITVHAMKSALANVGENAVSARAAALEKAGRGGDETYIKKHTPDFIAALEALIHCEQSPSSAAGGGEAAEDTPYLAEQAAILQTACARYDDDAAFAVLNRLKEKVWKTETNAALEEIRDRLYIYSDFEGAAERAAALARGR